MRGGVNDLSSIILADQVTRGTLLSWCPSRREPRGLVWLAHFLFIKGLREGWLIFGAKDDQGGRGGPFHICRHIGNPGNQGFRGYGANITIWNCCYNDLGGGGGGVQAPKPTLPVKKRIADVETLLQN